MNWYQEQINERRRADQQALEDSFQKIAGVVLGQRIAEKLGDDRIVTRHAIDEILKYYHCKPADIPRNVKTAGEQLDYSLRRYGIMRRSVELRNDWYRDSFGPLLGFWKDTGMAVALLPRGLGGYHYHDEEMGRTVKIKKEQAERIDTNAICFYFPLPQKELGIQDLLRYMGMSASFGDKALAVSMAVVYSMVGLMLPRLTAALTGPVLFGRNTSVLMATGICLLCILLSTGLIGIIRGLFEKRLVIKISMGVESAMMMRLLSLPVSFFRSYSPGELKSRSASVNTLCDLLLNLVLSSCLTCLGSLLYITQIIKFTPTLAVPSVCVILITVIFTMATAYVQTGISRRRMEQEAGESGISYALITGIQKLKLAGAEKRAFAKWLGMYAKGAELTYNPPYFLKISSVIRMGITLFSNIILYYTAVRTGVTRPSYFAFAAAYAMVMTAFSSVAELAASAAEIKPILEMAEPFLKTVPETSSRREIVTSISGRVSLDHVSFRYNESSPYVIKDLSLKIKPGEYVAIVGRTGCGKSTLIRLLLGFEEPEKGAVYYDERDICTLDTCSLRRHIGSVTQDGGLFQGDIFSNIAISAPNLTIEQAWEAAETADIADDIRAMPMGMYTYVLEGQGGISGGQKQRLMIARAVASKPKLLIFDEATSALDNKSQKQVSEALDKMGCTRIVVAHRLSTIRHCDRIVVLDGGSIIEDGTYEELIAQGGFFADLIERQRLDEAG